MKPRATLLGRYLPIDTWLHRAPPLLKFLVLAGLSVLVLAFRDLWLNLGVCTVVLGLGFSARIPARALFSALRAVWILVLALAVFHVLVNGIEAALDVTSTILVCVLAAGLVLVTTSLTELLGVFTALARPLAVFGVRPARVGLAAVLMVRSVPRLAGLARTARDSARARGIERSVRARTVPVVLGTVVHAQQTGRALEARGLDEEG
ncbi:energy-coupling factor transporter transmembrane protein EcfT [Brevibacterium samyangense]|uniref:Energy-coupling factor transporter transmembrane protein EcfT n=1 Tax=Brevibacterium samyangense TaxID=366888 RepID=A0ABP5EKH3_9MICO